MTYPLAVASGGGGNLLVFKGLFECHWANAQTFFTGDQKFLAEVVDCGYNWPLSKCQIQFTIYSFYGFQLAIAVLVFIYLLHWVNLIPALAFVYSHICYTGLT